MSSRADLLAQRVAWLSVELGEILELEHELTPSSREALLAVCGDVAGKLERLKLERAGRDQASGPERGGP
jgi:hypothetical protein